MTAESTLVSLPDLDTTPSLDSPRGYGPHAGRGVDRAEYPARLPLLVLPKQRPRPPQQHDNNRNPGCL